MHLYHQCVPCIFVGDVINGSSGLIVFSLSSRFICKVSYTLSRSYDTRKTSVDSIVS